MNILCATDASDDGYRALAALAKALDPSQVDKVKIVMVTWPERQSPLWQKAYNLWLDKDDLHAAMATTIDRELKHYTNLFEGHAKAIETEERVGNPAVDVLESAKNAEADLILLGVTGDAQAHSVQRIVEQIVSESPTPVIVAYGHARTVVE